MVTEAIFFGVFGTGTMMVADGGRLSVGGLAMGFENGSNGTLNVNAGGTVETKEAYLGDGTGMGTATVGGTGARWDVGIGLYVGGSDSGSGGTGTLTVNAGGTVAAGSLTVWNGNSSISTGSTTIRNGGTIDTSSLRLQGGGTATGYFGIVDNAVSNSVFGIIADSATIDGGRWNAAEHDTGFTGTGTTTVTNGGVLASDYSGVGVFDGSNGTLNVNGGTVTTSGNGVLGRNIGATGAANVGGTGARWDVGNGLYVGGSDSGSGGTGTLTVNAGGTVTADSLTVWNSNSVANINAGGSVVVSNLVDLKSGSRINLDGSSLMAGTLNNNGTLAASAISAVHGQLTNSTNGIIRVAGTSTTLHDSVKHNGAEFRVDNGAKVIFNGNYSGGGDFTGAGELVFAGSVLPGNSPDLISIEGDMTLLASTMTTMELGGLSRGALYDAYDIGGTLSLAGTLKVDLISLGGDLFSPAHGDSFDLFSAANIVGIFSELQLDPLPDGLSWNIQYLVDVDGSTDIVRLSVAQIPVQEPQPKFTIIPMLQLLLED